MNKILLVIQREYLTRIQKKSFWVASLLGPILITAIYAVPIWLAMQDKDVKRVEILDESGLFQHPSPPYFTCRNKVSQHPWLLTKNFQTF